MKNLIRGEDGVGCNVRATACLICSYAWKENSEALIYILTMATCFFVWWKAVKCVWLELNYRTFSDRWQFQSEGQNNESLNLPSFSKLFLLFDLFLLLVCVALFLLTNECLWHNGIQTKRCIQLCPCNERPRYEIRRISFHVWTFLHTGKIASDSIQWLGLLSHLWVNVNENHKDGSSFKYLSMSINILHKLYLKWPSSNKMVKIVEWLKMVKVHLIST